MRLNRGARHGFVCVCFVYIMCVFCVYYVCGLCLNELLSVFASTLHLTV